MNTRAVRTLVLALLALLAAASSLWARVPAQERAALVSLYRSTGGDQWRDRSGWLGKAGTECRWRGVVCDAAGSAVVEIRLASNGLTGGLPAEVADLTRLRALDLRANALQGEIPAGLGRGASLEILDLAFNKLSGEVPHELGRLSRLRALSLEHNGFTSVPTGLGRLRSLQALDLSFNPIADLPADFARLESLRSFALRGGGLTGIPAALLEIRNLQDVDLSGNPMTGAEVPDAIGNLEQVVRLSCASCGLTGLLPSGIGRLGWLSELDLRDNALAGLPPEIGRLGALQRLLLAGNRLTTVPDGIGGATALRVLDLSWNLLETVPPDMADLPLVSLDLSGNRLGELPPGIGGMTGLRTLRAPWNRLAGEIPDLSRLASLETLDLSGNPFAPRPLPEGLRNLRGLRELRLRDTRRTGEIPLWLLELERVAWLDLGENPFDPAPLPFFFVNLPGLRRLLLDRTERTGPLPEWIGQMPLTLLALRDNPFSPGPLPEFLATTRIAHVDLGGTGRTGLLPAEVAGNPTLRVLRLDHNHLRGPLPPEWGSFPSLEILDLAANRLAGTVPRELEALSRLRDAGGLDLRWNGLTQGDPEVVAWLNQRQADAADWRSTQTMPPRNLQAALTGPARVRLSWTPIRYRDTAGGYEVLHATAPEGPFTVAGFAAGKQADSLELAGLAPRSRHYFRVRSVTFAHADNPNRVTSLPGPVVEITTLPEPPRSWKQTLLPPVPVSE